MVEVGKFQFHFANRIDGAMEILYDDFVELSHQLSVRTRKNRLFARANRGGMRMSGWLLSQTIRGMDREAAFIMGGVIVEYILWLAAAAFLFYAAAHLWGWLEREIKKRRKK